MRFSRALAPLGLCAIWLLMIWLVDPRGDFPLGDDWLFASAVRGLLETGEYRLPDLTMMTLLTQVLWGYGFSLWFGGASFEILRASTITLGLAAALAVYWLLREAGACRRVAFVAAAALAVNPIFFVLACTFMSDVPFVAFSALSLACYARALRLSSPAMVVLGTVFSIAAVLVRQLGLVLPISFCVAHFVRQGTRTRSISIALLPMLASLLAYLGYQHWLAAHGGMPARFVSLAEHFRSASSDGVAAAAAVTWWNCVWIALYIGFFALPVAVLAIPRLRGVRWRAFAVWGIAAALATGALVEANRMFPYLGNILSRRGLGAFTLRGIPELGLAELARIPWPAAAGATLASILSAGVLAYLAGSAALELLRRFRDDRVREQAWVGALALAFAAPYSALIATGSMFDRYILPLAVVAPLWLAAAAGQGARRPAPLAASAALLLMLAAFSVAATHDYFAWNRARWDALRQLTSQGVPPALIDGGFEFNGTHLYREDFQKVPGKSWWWVQDDEYIVAFSRIPGYRVVNRQLWDRWLFGRQERIYTLRRLE
jgi:hypothetical protein